MFKVLFRYNLDAIWRNKQHVFFMQGYFLLISLLFPLALGGESALLQQVAWPVLWTLLLIVIQQTVVVAYTSEYQSGALLAFKQCGADPIMMIFSKWLAYCMTYGSSLVLFTITMSIFYHNNISFLAVLALLISVLGVFALAMMMSLLLMDVEHAQMVQMLVALPLLIPVLLFGVQVVDGEGFWWNDSLTALLAWCLILVPLSIFIAAKLLLALLKDG